MLYQIKVKGGFLNDNATGVPLVFFTWMDAFFEVAKLVGDGQEAEVATYGSSDEKDSKN